MNERKLSPRAEFDKEMMRRAAEFDLALTDEARARLGDYFALVADWNPRLHLTAPCSPAEFAVRHVLESLAALPLLDDAESLVDVGSGAGLPALPCLVVRDGLRALLVESSRRKAVFLREAVARLGLRDRVEIKAERFETLPRPRADALTCRAIERFTEILPVIVEWAANIPRLVLFGGEKLREEIERRGWKYEAVHIPGSEKRYVFVVVR